MTTEDALKQRLSWLEEERRKDHSLILALQERLVSLEGDYRAVSDQIKTLEGDVASTRAALGRFDQLEGAIARIEQEAAQRVDDLEQRVFARLRDSEASQRQDVEVLRERLAEMHKKIEALLPVTRAVEQRAKEIAEVRHDLQLLEARLESVEHTEDDRKRALHLLQESQERNAKRLIDMQGEIAAFRRRLEEQGAQMQVFGETFRKLETRLQEVAATEARRKQEQKDFLEAQNRRWLAWERTWKEWETRFQTLEALSQQVEERLRAWDDLQRDVKRAQEHFEAMTERMERRINEITEVQRLAEDRFRQEWATFKADDQKRWANYLLAQDERVQDTERRLGQLTDQLAQLQDQLQALDDVVKISDEQVRKRLQKLVTMTQEWMSEYERMAGTIKNS